MGLACGWFRMILRVIPLFCFGILRISEEIVKRGKLENLGIFGLLHRNVGNLRRDVDLH